MEDKKITDNSIPEQNVYVYRKQRFPALKSGVRKIRNIPARLKAFGRGVADAARRVGRFFARLPKNTKKILSAAGKGIAAFVRNPVKTTRVWKEKIVSADKAEIRAYIFGRGDRKGLLPRLVGYCLLVLFGFVYLYPMLYMAAYSFMSQSDVINPMVNYVPTKIYFGNYSEAMHVLEYWKALFETLLISVPSALLQTLSVSLTAYGLARFKFPGRRLIFVFVLITFIIPPGITMMPQVLLFSKIGLTDSLLAYYVPAIFGQGLKSAVFMLIFYQFFRSMPKAMEEAAKIDGSKSLMIYFRLGIPIAMPGFLLSFLLSLVWYYNETILAAVYFGNEWTTLPLQLEKFQAAYEKIFGSASATGKSINEAINMAGTVLTILPLLVIFFFTQRFFTEGIDKAGITGE